MSKVLLTISVLTLLLVRVGGVEAQWVPTNGPYSNIVNCVFANGTVLYAGTNGNGVLRSMDNGVTWNPANKGLDGIGFVAAFAASGNNLFVSITVEGVYRSSDSGNNWTRVSNGLYPYVESLALLGNTILAGTSEGIFRSLDNGTSWVLSDTGLSDPFTHALISFGTTFIAGTSGGIYRSTDSGSSWLVAANWYVNTIAVDGNELFAGTDDAVLHSFDSGRSWSLVPSRLTGKQVNAIAVIGSSLFVGTMDSGVFLSRDTGSTWLSIPSGSASKYINSLSAIGTDIFAGTYDGLFRSSGDGTVWEAVKSVMPYGTFAKALATIGPYLFAGTDWNGVFRSSDNGLSWEPMNNGIPSQYHGFVYCNGLFAHGSLLFTYSGGTGFYRSTDSGLSWVTLRKGLTKGVNALAFQGSHLLAGTTAGVFLSSDSGLNWNGLDTARLANSIISALAVTPNRLFAAEDSTVIYSIDNGDSWVETGMRFPSAVTTLTLLGSNLFAVLEYNSIFRSTDSGLTWKQCGNGIKSLGYQPTLCLVDNNLYAFGASTNYLSRDSGFSWKQGKDQLFLATYALANNGNFLFIGTNGQGVWKLPLEAFGSVLQNADASRSIYNFPNPFSASTTVNITTVESGPVEISIHNLLGTEVIRLFSGELGAGEHSFTWDARGLPPGMYECAVRMGGNVQHVPIILER